MWILTMLVAFALFGILGPRLMGRVDRFIGRSGSSSRAGTHDNWASPPHKKSA